VNNNKKHQQMFLHWVENIQEDYQVDTI